MGFGRGKGQEGRGERGGAHQGLDLGGDGPEVRARRAAAGARFRPGLGTAEVEERWRRVRARLRSSGREGFERGGELEPGGRAAASSARSRRALRKKERNGMGREGSRVLAMITIPLIFLSRYYLSDYVAIIKPQAVHPFFFFLGKS